MNNGKMQFVVLQKGKKEPVSSPNGGWLLTTNYDAYDDLAIYLGDQEGVVMVDFDSLKENLGYEKKLLEVIQKNYPCNFIVATDKGYHLYYKTTRKIGNYVKRLHCCGIKTDYRMGKAYCIIKRNGKTRNYYGEPDFDNLTELPDILLPLSSKDKEIQAGITQGSRNLSLFEHLKLICKRYDYDTINLLEIALFINKYLYEPPMDDDEVEGIVKSVLSYDIKPSNSKKEYNYNFLAKMVLKYKIHIVDSKLFFLYGNHYINDDYLLLKTIYNETPFSLGDVEEYLFYFKMNAQEWEKEDVILLNNGIIKDGIFFENEHVFTPYYLDITYKKDSYNEDLDKFLQFISGNEEKVEKNDLRIVLEEMFGHCLMFKDFPHKIFLLVGNGKNGKSTLLNLLYKVFNGMYSNVPLNYMDKDNYVARLVNKLANISDDIDYNYLVSSQNIKTIASGDYLSARELYGKSFNFKSTATQIYSMNELVKFKDKSYGMERRLCIIPFINEVQNVDPHILQKITTDEAKSYFLSLALSGVQRIKENGYNLSKSKTIEKTLQRYLNESDTVRMFFYFEDLGELDGRKFSNVYEIYKQFCIDNELIPCTKNGFSRRLRAKGYVCVPRKINNKSTRVIVKEEKDE